jgi:hypothetical protein
VSDDDIEASAERRLQAVLGEQDATDDEAATAPERPPLNLPPGLHLDVPEADYHLDCSEGVSLSASIANEIATRSPRHGWRLHPRLGAQRKAGTAAMRAGSLVHMLALGSGPKVRLVEADNWKKKKPQEEKAAALAAGELPVLAREFEAATGIVVALHTELKRRGIDLAPMTKEVTAIWREGDVLCRGRADAWDEASATLYDLKFLSDAEPKAVGRHMMDYGCDVQEAAYRSGFERLFPDLAGRIAFKLIVVEQKTGELLIVKPGGGMRALGEFKWGYAVRRFGECLAAGVWPGYNEGEEAIVDAPEWATRDLLKGGSQGLTF